MRLGTHSVETHLYDRRSQGNETMDERAVLQQTACHLPLRLLRQQNTHLHHATQRSALVARTHHTQPKCSIVPRP